MVDVQWWIAMDTGLVSPHFAKALWGKRVRGNDKKKEGL